ncbi:MAG TPA: transglycosylase SLT domain-containing protein [Pyrinomonadaceae bacterium]
MPFKMTKLLRHLFIFLSAALFLFSHAPKTCAQTLRERQEKIRAAVESRDDATAIAALEALRASEPSVFQLNNYDYLLARLSQRRGETATAAASYESAVARRSQLSPYALWHLSQLARAAGNLTLERQHLRRLNTFAPNSLLREAASKRLAESYFESGDDSSAIAILRPRSGTQSAAAREALALLGHSLMRSNQNAQARAAFQSLVAQMPDASRPDDFALAGARGLDLLDSGSAEAARQRAPQLAESEHLRRALIYSFNRDFAGARLHYQAIAERYSQSASVPDALYQIGRGFYQEGRFEEAASYFKRVLDQYPDSASARDAIGFLASSYNRLQRTDEAVAAYRRAIERYADAPNPERPYLNIIDALREAGRDEEALQWVQKTRGAFKGEAGAALALFSQARIHLAQGAWSAALSDVEMLRNEADLGGMRLPGGTSQTEVSFLRAYLLEMSARQEEAVNAYLSIPDGRNEYYGARSTRRLRALGKDERTRNIIAARLNALRAEAQKALAEGRAENARQSAQQALRLTEDASTARELLDIARRAYSSLPAYNRFPPTELVPLGRQQLLTSGVREEASEPTHRALADELLFLGLYDEGMPELAAALDHNAAPAAKKISPTEEASKPAASSNKAKTESNREKPELDQSRSSTPAGPSSSSREMAYTLAVYFRRGEHADRAVRYAEPLWKNVPADYLLELAPREMVELLYPVPYKDALLESAPQRGVDARFVLSIARQETRFRPEAKSVAAARGLMQFIPSTAKEIAAQLGRTAFEQDDLYNPQTAILLGSQYLSNLFKRFPDQPQAVAASYNGGDDNMARWMARARSNDPDRYVVEIGFTQTKDYVFKVMNNYWTYQTLYTDRLERR